MGKKDPPNGSNPPKPAVKIDKSWFLFAILLAGTILYVVAVFWIGLGSIRHVREIAAQAQEADSPPEANSSDGGASDNEDAKPEPYPISDFITQALLVIGGALATHLGAYLGITITDTTQGLLSKGTNILAYLKSPSGLSGILAAIYFLALIAAIIFWSFTGFSPYAGKPLQDLAYSFLGVFAGALAALSKGD